MNRAPSQATAVVIGAGVSGLAATAALAGRLAHVTLIDRDVLPDTAVPRRGVPQSGQAHLLLRGGLDALEQLLPGFFADLVANGGLPMNAGRNVPTFQFGALRIPFDSAIEQFDSSIKTVDEELANITAQISELRASGGEGATDLDAQVQAATQRLLEILAQGTVDDTQVQPILDQLQTLQLIQALRGDDPVLASLIESRNQALERRSQLALRRDQLRVDSALTSTGISVISPAREAGQALSLPRALLIGLLLGTVIGAVVAFAFASRSKRFLHRSEPELVLNAPLLAEIPRYDGGRRGHGRPRRDGRRCRHRSSESHGGPGRHGASCHRGARCHGGP